MVLRRISERVVQVDFGSVYVGTMEFKARGPRGSRIVLRYGQELTPEGRVRFDLRANCRYEEEWILSGGNDTLQHFDYLSFRYAEMNRSLRSGSRQPARRTMPSCAVFGISALTLSDTARRKL